MEMMACERAASRDDVRNVEEMLRTDILETDNRVITVLRRFLIIF